MESCGLSCGVLLMSEKEYEALERFSIMLENNISVKYTLNYIMAVYGREIAVKLWERYKNEISV